MAVLLVQSASEDGHAAPGNRENFNICLSVTNGAGVPVTGLAASNVKLDALIVGAGGAQTNITSFLPRMPGYYNMKVVPIGTETWRPGVYIFGLAVTKGGDQGQCISTPVLLD